MMERTFGAEIEFVVPTRAEVSARRNLPTNFRMESDGSVRNYDHRAAACKFIQARNSDVECGGEIVSPPLTLAELPIFRPIFLNLYYEQLEAPHATTSIHIHVYAGDFSHSTILGMWEKSLEWEQFFYDVSVPRNQTGHRGLHNDFIYCRPLKSPPWSRDADTGREGSSIGKFSQAENFTEMYYTLGNWARRRNKWHPSRYTGINFCALSEHRTIEFRMFNSTENFGLFMAWVELCLGFVEKRGCGSPETWVSTRAYDKLLENMRETYSKINMSPVMTHLQATTIWEGNKILDPDLYPYGTARTVPEPKPMKKCLIAGQEKYITRRIG